MVLVAATPRAWSSSTLGFETILKPQGYFTAVGLEGASVLGDTGGSIGAFVERVGHVLTWRPVVLRSAAVHPLAWSRMVCNTSLGGQRCEFYTSESLQEAYDLDSRSRNAVVDHDALIVDYPRTLRGHEETEALAELALEPAARMHLELADRARQQRLGRHIYPRCGVLSPPSRTVHQNAFDLAWLLSPLWGTQTPLEVSFVDVGCHEFSGQDPLASLLLGPPLALSGLCLDVDALALAKAKERLAGHAVDIVQGFWTPVRLKSLLSERLAGAPVDVLKVDIDSFDVDLLDAALASISVSVVICEFRYGIPPPFQYARHYSGETSFLGEELEEKAVGISLSYLVEHLFHRGFLLYKMNEVDTVWIRRDLAARFAELDEGLGFPVDEWACYLRTPFYLGDARAKFPLSFTREWLLDADVFRALARVWGNLSALSQGAPFSLDVASARLPQDAA